MYPRLSLHVCSVFGVGIAYVNICCAQINQHDSNSELLSSNKYCQAAYMPTYEKPLDVCEHLNQFVADCHKNNMSQTVISCICLTSVVNDFIYANLLLGLI